jgi:DivIVA domain-containing protein
MRRKKAAEDRPVPASGDGRITPIEVQQVEFRLAFRGYNERDVDAFLDRITEDLTAYIEENERVRAGGAVPSGPSASEGEGEDARGQADAIVARAREEAAGIVRAAEQRAAAIAASGSAGPGDPRAAVAPFLSREREFLQNLGGLVQGHAEEIKQMVLAVRAHAEAAKQPGEPGEPDAASAAEIRERLGEPESEGGAASVPAEAMTEPAYSTEGAPAGEGRERSLRELFWGEE